MLSRGHVYRVQPGSDVQLNCEFCMERFQLFANPIIWTKQQENETTTMNVMKVIQEPFSSTQRFRVELIELWPIYRLVLHING